MSQQYVIEFGTGERAILEAEDTTWVGDRVRERPGPMSLKVRSDDTDDTEGHWRTGPRVRVLIESDDDVEGHALAIHFPTAAEADAFRRRLLLAGVLAGTVAVGTVAGIGLANLPASDAGTAGSAAVVTQAGPMDANEAIAFDAQARGDQAWSDRLQAQADAQARGDQAWSDRLQAQADAQAAATSVDDEVEGLGGPIPR